MHKVSIHHLASMLGHGEMTDHWLLCLQEYVLVTFETLEGAVKAVQVLNGTSLPSGGTLSVHFAPVMHETGGAAAAGQPGIGECGNLVSCPAPSVVGSSQHNNAL